MYVCIHIIYIYIYILKKDVLNTKAFSVTMIAKIQKMTTKKLYPPLRYFIPTLLVSPLIFQKMSLPQLTFFGNFIPPLLLQKCGMKLEGDPQDINRYATNGVFRTLLKKL